MQSRLSPLALFVLSLIGLWSSSALSQEGETAKSVYRIAEPSVFLIYLNDDTGKPVALGSAWVVASKMLITNAHVVERGNPVIAIGPVRIPVKVVRTDTKNDLALLSVDADLSAPLKLNTSSLTSGEQVFAIGNPEGLEKTISAGIVSGKRHREETDLLQITSPISHGSSGGPILDRSGAVVGVAVGILEEGQNLNFAIPVRYVLALLSRSDADIVTTPLDEATQIERIRALLDQRARNTYSEDEASDYQKRTSKLIQGMRSALTTTHDPRSMSDLACIGTAAAELSDSGVQAARSLLKVNPSTVSRAMLAWTLYDRASNARISALFAKERSPEQKQGQVDYERYLGDAEHEALLTAAMDHNKKQLIAEFVLGKAAASRNDYKTVINHELAVAQGRTKACSMDISMEANQDVIVAYSNLKRPEDAELWFRNYAAAYTPEAYEWDAEGDRRHSV